MSDLKKLAGDSATSAELWLLPIPLVLISEGEISDVQSVAVALCYAAFVAGRVTVKRDGLRALGARVGSVAPLMLAGLVLALLPSCATPSGFFDQPVAGGGSVTIVNDQGQATTIDTDAQLEGSQTVDIEGLGTVTIDPGHSAPPATLGDQTANATGQTVAWLTGVPVAGLLVTKLLGGLIGSRRKKPKAQIIHLAPQG